MAGINVKFRTSDSTIDTRDNVRSTVYGVRGSKEASYKTGWVVITPEDLGIDPLINNRVYYLETNLDQEIQDRTSADNVLAQRINQETLDRQSADSTLQSNISSERTQRINADDNLNSKINDEIDDREFADNALSNRIDGKQDTIDVNNKLSSDLVDDTNKNHKFVTQSEKTQITTNKNDISNLNTNKVDKTTTVNGKPLSGNVNLKTSDIPNDSGYIDKTVSNLENYTKTTDLQRDYQTKIDNSHKLSSDLVDDTDKNHKFVTATEKTQITTNKNNISNLQSDVTNLSNSKQDKIDSSHKLDVDLTKDGVNNKVFTASEKTKLSGIEPGAQVNPEALKNPYKLKINEAGTNKTYDGSSEVTITIPSVTDFATKSQAVGSVTLTLNSSDYKVTLQCKDVNGTNIGNAQIIDLPLESVVVSGSYDSVNKKIVLTLQNGSTIDIPVGDLVAGLQSELSLSNKLDADFIKDGNVNKVFTSQMLSQINKNTSDISHIQDGVSIDSFADVESTFSSVYSSISTIVSEISGVNSELINLSSRIDVNESYISDIQADVSNIYSSISNIYSSISDISSSVVANTDSISSIFVDLSAIHSSVSQNVSDITNLYSDISAIDSSISSMIDDISNIQSFVSSASASISSIYSELSNKQDLLNYSNISSGTLSNVLGFDDNGRVVYGVFNGYSLPIIPVDLLSMTASLASSDVMFLHTGSTTYNSAYQLLINNHIYRNTEIETTSRFTPELVDYWVDFDSQQVNVSGQGFYEGYGPFSVGIRTLSGMLFYSGFWDSRVSGQDPSDKATVTSINWQEGTYYQEITGMSCATYSFKFNDIPTRVINIQNQYGAYVRWDGESSHSMTVWGVPGFNWLASYGYNTMDIGLLDAMIEMTNFENNPHRIVIRDNTTGSDIECATAFELASHHSFYGTIDGSQGIIDNYYLIINLDCLTGGGLKLYYDADVLRSDVNKFILRSGVFATNYYQISNVTLYSTGWESYSEESGYNYRAEINLPMIITDNYVTSLNLMLDSSYTMTGNFASYFDTGSSRGVYLYAKSIPSYDMTIRGYLTGVWYPNEFDSLYY